jgi:hypothetical protein
LLKSVSPYSVRYFVVKLLTEGYAFSFPTSTPHPQLLIISQSLEIIGEAAGRISESMKNTHQEIPWCEITGMRNRLIHGYFEVDLDTVWDTTHQDLPLLIQFLEPLIPPEDPF